VGQRRPVWVWEPEGEVANKDASYNETFSPTLGHSRHL